MIPEPKVFVEGTVLSQRELTRLVLHQLDSVQCRCSRPKRPGYSFCPVCYRKLPRDFQKALYKRVGVGYEPAYMRALDFLHKLGRIQRPEWMKNEATR